jgi:dienelactone hydrolase
LIRDEILTISGGGFDLVTAANNQVSFGGTNVAASAINGSNLEVRVPTTLSTGDVNITVTVNTLTTNAVTANMPVTSVNISGGLH